MPNTETQYILMMNRGEAEALLEQIGAPSNPNVPWAYIATEEQKEMLQKMRVRLREELKK